MSLSVARPTGQQKGKAMQIELSEAAARLTWRVEMAELEDE